MAYGNANHTLKLTTSTSFFNNEDRGATTPTYTKAQAAGNTVMLDSWLSVGAACSGNFGVMKTEDNGTNNVVNTNGLLVNNNTSVMGIPLTTQDGLLTGSPQTVTFVGISSELSVFDQTSQAGNSFVINNGAWAALSGATGPTTSNRVLIAQMTTDGIFHYELNIQIGTPSGGVEKYVTSNPISGEIAMASLTGTFYAPITATIAMPDTVKHVNNAVTMPINTTALTIPNNAISYQFNLTYDPAKLQYVSNNLTGTIATSGTVTVNSTTPGLLHVSYMTSTPLNGTGSLLNLNFNPLAIGTFPLTISNFLYNTDTIHGITNGHITSIGLYGDIDTNNYVQAYDAALALQYSVGLDPLPLSDPLPWENWRLIVANVDNVNPVSANDASLILQYSAGLISTFPAEGSKSLEDPIADITISQNNSNLVFTSTGTLFGLNIYSTNGTNVTMGTPNVVFGGMLSAFNISGSLYNIGLCSSVTPGDNTVIMTIPLTCTSSETLSFNMIINKNSVTKNFNVSCTSEVAENTLQSVNIYPNPAKDNIEVIGLNNGTVDIINIQGQIVKSFNTFNSTTIDISDLSSGVYSIRIKTDDGILVKKMIKQ